MAKKAFDKDKWLAEKVGKIEDAKAALEAGLAALQTSDEWAAMLTSVARNVRRRLAVTRYSFGNQVLLAGQALARGAAEPTSVGTFKAWERLGRSVKKGERGMLILAPKPWKKEVERDGERVERRGTSFGTAYVFDVSQTEGAKSTDVVQRSGDRIVKAATRILDAVLGKVEAVPESEEAKEVA